MTGSNDCVCVAGRRGVVHVSTRGRGERGAGGGTRRSPTGVGAALSAAPSGAGIVRRASHGDRTTTEAQQTTTGMLLFNIQVFSYISTCRCELMRMKHLQPLQIPHILINNTMYSI